MIFDGLWMDHYLETYPGVRVLGHSRARQIFRGGGVCIYTMAGTLRGAPYLKWGMQRVPAEWYGNIPHPQGHRRRPRLCQCARQTLLDLGPTAQGRSTESMYR